MKEKMDIQIDCSYCKDKPTRPQIMRIQGLANSIISTYEKFFCIPYGQAPSLRITDLEGYVLSCSKEPNESILKELDKLDKSERESKLTQIIENDYKCWFMQSDLSKHTIWIKRDSLQSNYFPVTLAEELSHTSYASYQALHQNYTPDVEEFYMFSCLMEGIAKLTAQNLCNLLYKKGKITGEERAAARKLGKTLYERYPKTMPVIGGAEEFSSLGFVYISEMIKKGLSPSEIVNIYDSYPLTMKDMYLPEILQR